MDSKVAELMEKAERRHMLRGALACVTDIVEGGGGDMTCINP